MKRIFLFFGLSFFPLFSFSEISSGQFSEAVGVLINIREAIQPINQGNYLNSILNSLNLVKSQAYNHYTWLESSLGSSVGINLNNIDLTLNDIRSFLSDLNISDYSSVLSSINSKIVDRDYSSAISSIDSKLGGLEDIVDSLGYSLGSDVSSIADYFESDKVYDDSNWSEFRNFYKKGSYSIVPDSTQQFQVFNTSSGNSSWNNVAGLSFSTFPDLIVRGFSRIIYSQSLLNRNLVSSDQMIFNLSSFLKDDLYTTLGDLSLISTSIGDSLGSDVSSISSSVGDSLGSDVSSISSSVGDSIGSDVSQIQITLSDIKSLLENFDQGGGDSGGSDDPTDDPWIEFRETYLTLFDNQPIPTYEIDYALIAWETNSVATKATLTQTSGNFFDLCLAFAMDANKIAGSESIFLHKILDYLPELKPPAEKDTTEDENRVNGQITDVSGQISTLNQTFNYEDLIFKEESVDFFDHDTITGQFKEESLPANITIVIPPIFNFQTQVFTIPTAGFSDFFDHTRAFCAVLYYVLLCGFIWFVFKCFLLCCSKFGKVIGFVLQW